MSTISAIIVNYNSGDMLGRAVQSLLEEKDVLEIFVVDNASVDDSIKQIERLAVSTTRLKCIRNNTNMGFAKACNIALAVSSGNNVLFLNPDCIVQQGTLGKLLFCLKSFSQAGMVGPLLLNSDGTEQAGGRRAVPTPWRSFVRVSGLYKLSSRYPRLFSDFYLHLQPLPDGPVEVEAISGACMLVKRQAINDVGMMDEKYFLHCEDLDWCTRFRQHGWKIFFMPDAPVTHYQGSCSQRKRIFVEWHKHKGMVRFYGKFFHHQYPGILFWVVKAGVWFRFTAIVLYHMFTKTKEGLKI